jgi:hypothetical protein
MTITAMKPNFTSRDTYLGWRHLWKTVHTRMSVDLRREKIAVKDAHRRGDPDAAKKQRALHFNRRVAFKFMTLLQDAMVRWARIRSMQKEIAEQPFPLMLPDAKNVDFHFNKGHVEFPFLPMWVLRAKGRSYYVHEVDFSAPCTTKERATGSTKGVLRFRRCSIAIDDAGNAVVGEYTGPTATLAKRYSGATQQAAV